MNEPEAQPHDANHPYVRQCVGCGHGVLFTEPCVECEIVSLQDQYRRAVRTVQTVRDRMRVLGRPMPGETSGGHRAPAAHKPKENNL